jgi:YegS/Rv2252/BmrU family lipid kinase
MRIVAVVNPISGRGMDASATADRIAMMRAAFDRRGLDGSVVVTERAGHARELAARAVESGTDLVLVWGGDGTVNEVGTALMGSSTAMGLVPAGSGNGLAGGLAVPRQPAAAIAAALDGRVKPVDVGMLDERPFFNVAGIGFDAHVALLFNQRPRGRRGPLPYVMIGFREGVRYAGLTYNITLAGDHGTTTTIHKALLVAFANGVEYGMGLRIAPAARLDDGLLDCCVVEDRPVLARVLHARHLLRDRIDRAPGLLMRTVRSATIEAELDITYHVDGEPGVAGRTVVVTIRPGALLVRS